MSLPALTVKILGDASSYQQALRDAQRQTSDFASTISSAMRTAGGVLSGVVTAPLTAIGGGGMGLANAVELEMSRVEGLVGIAGNIVAQWRDQLPSIGEAVGKSGLELSQALFYITSAGLRGQTAIDALTMSAKASVAGLGETLKVADAVTSAINAYQKTGMTAAMATDILTAAVREGKLEAASLAPIMGRVLPIASAMKVDFAEVAGAIAVMSRVGAKAAEGSVAIQAFLSGLMKPSKKGVGALKSVGLEFEDLREMVKKPGGLIAAMRLLDEKFGDNEEALAAVVPNIRSLRGVLNVLSQDAKIVDSVMGGVRNSVGDTDKAFEVSARTASVQLDIAMVRVRNTLSAVGRTVAAVLIPWVQKGIVYVSMLRDAWVAMDPEVRKTVVIFGMLAAAAGPVLMMLGGLFPLLMTGVGLVTTPLTLLVTLLPTMIGGVTLAVAGYLLLSDVLVDVGMYLWEQVQAWSGVLIAIGAVVGVALVAYSAMRVLWTILVALRVVQVAQIALWLVYKAVLASVAVVTFLWNTSMGLSLVTMVLVKLATIAWNVILGILVGTILVVKTAIHLLTTAVGLAKLAFLALYAVLLFFVGSVVFAGIMATVSAVGALYTALTSVVDLGGPISYIGGLFGEWWTILVKVFDLLKGGNMEGAWAVFSAGARLAIEQVKALWTPLWSFLSQGFEAVWQYVLAVWDADFNLKMEQARMTMAGVAGVFVSSKRMEEERAMRENLANAQKMAAKAMLNAQFDPTSKGGIKWNDPAESQGVKDARKALADTMTQIAMDDMTKGTWLDFDTWSKVSAGTKMVGDQIDENIKNPIAMATKEVQKFDAALVGSSEAIARLYAYRQAIAFVPPTSAVGKSDGFAPGIVGAGGGAAGLGAPDETTPILEQIRDLLKEKGKEVTILGAEIL